MDFEGIEKVRQRVRQNGTLAQQLVQLQGQMARLTAALAQQPGGTQNGAGHCRPDGTAAGGGGCPRHELERKGGEVR